MVKPGTIIAYMDANQITIGKVQSILELGTHFLLLHHVFTSGLVDLDGQKCVETSSLDTTKTIPIEINTRSLTIAAAFPQHRHLSGHLVLVV